MATPVSGADSWLTLNNVPLRFGPGAANLVDGVREYSYNLFRITEAAPDDVEVYVDNERLETERYGSWTWRPESYAGLYSVRVSAPGHAMHETQVRVLPGNITLRQQAQMYADITDISVDLLFSPYAGAKHAGIAPADAYNRRSAPIG